MLKLFYSVGSCARAAHIALAEAGASYEAVRIDLRAGDQRKPEFQAINPKGRVPALLTGRGVLTENPAILAFIAQAFPEAGLAPTDPWAFGQAQAFNNYLSSTVHVAHAHKYRGYRWADEETSFEDMRRKIPRTMGEAFRLIEEELLRGPWVLGETYSVCDAYLFTLSDWLEEDGVDVSVLPRVLDHRERVRARPATQRVLAEELA